MTPSQGGAEPRTPNPCENPRSNACKIEKFPNPNPNPNPNRVRFCRVNQITWRRLSDNLAYLTGCTKKSLAGRFNVSPKTFDRWCCDRWTADGNRGRSTKRLGALPTEDQLQTCWRLAVEGFESNQRQIMLDHGKEMGISYELMQSGEITPSMFGDRCAMSTAKADRAVRELEDRLFQVWADVYLFGIVKANEKAFRAVERPDRPPKPLEVDIHPVTWYAVPEWHERAS